MCLALSFPILVVPAHSAQRWTRKWQSSAWLAQDCRHDMPHVKHALTVCRILDHDTPADLILYVKESRQLNQQNKAARHPQQFAARQAVAGHASCAIDHASDNCHGLRKEDPQAHLLQKHRFLESCCVPPWLASELLPGQVASQPPVQQSIATCQLFLITKGNKVNNKRKA